MVERLACEFNVARISLRNLLQHLSKNTENQAPPTAVPATDTATIIGSHQQRPKRADRATCFKRAQARSCRCQLVNCAHQDLSPHMLPRRPALRPAGLSVVLQDVTANLRVLVGVFIPHPANTGADVAWGYPIQRLVTSSGLISSANAGPKHLQSLQTLVSRGIRLHPI